MLYDVRTLKTSLEPSLCFVKPFLSSLFLNLMLFSIIYLSIAAEYKVDSTVIVTTEFCYNKIKRFKKMLIKTRFIVYTRMSMFLTYIASM